ncbi:MAG: tripartite tricarboxylate transporter TctB family protein [Betaproteobacteria bacterium]
MEKDTGPRPTSPGGIPTQVMEIAVALVFLALGSLVVYDSLRLGIRWLGDGPEAGYFPFYIGAVICIASLVTLAQAIFGRAARGRAIFVEWAPLRQVLSVLIPAGLYVLGVELLGIYVSGAAYIAVFMVWLGNYKWLKSIIVGFSVSAAMFLMFEVWFKVPLYKGAFNPLGFLGY